ncbi:MAG: hypothetical protein OXT67_02755 [Zetaproteobacteria bacterium]|nr:hypothetical protein [Zetaproteobacteria bacterium]
MFSRSNRIGVLITENEASKGYALEVLKGIRSALPDQHIYSSTVQPSLTIQTFLPGESIQAKVNQLVWQANVSLIIGGITQPEIEPLLQVSSGFELPVLLLNPEVPALRKYPHVFHVYPNTQELAKHLIRAAKEEKWETFTLLRGQGSEQEQFMKEIFVMLHQEKKMRVVQDLTFTPGNFASMEAAALKIANINPIYRKKEYANLVSQEQRRAQKEKRAFDPTKLVLPAKPLCDAVILPEDFRTLHYFVKLLKFHGIRQLPFLGNQNWRNRELIEPWDNFLQGSKFVDYVGLYSQLDRRITSSTKLPDFFLPPQEAPKLDFKLIGLRAGTIAKEALNSPLRSVTPLSQLLQRSLQPENGKPFFLQDHSSKWQTHVFTLNHGSLVHQ